MKDKIIQIPTDLARSDVEKPDMISYLVAPEPMLTKEQYEAGEDGYVNWDNINNKVIFYE